MSSKPRPCPCGSGKISYWQYDGYGIELCRTCEDCHDEKMKRYRPDIKERYETDEPIESEDGISFTDENTGNMIVFLDELSPVDLEDQEAYTEFVRNRGLGNHFLGKWH